MRTIWIYSILGILTLSSCREVIDVELPNSTPLLVVNGRITDTLPVEVQVFKSGPYFSHETIGISEVSVVLYENGIVVDSLVESDTAQGYYYGNHVGYEGGKYYIEATIQDGNPQFEGGTWVSIEEEIKRCPPIDSFYSEYREKEVFRPAGYYVAAHFHEPEGAGDNYRLRAWRNDSLQNTQFDIQIFNDDFNDGLNFNDDPIPALTVDGPKEIGTTYKLELGSVTAAYYDFMFLVRQQTVQIGSTFDAAPASIIGNIHKKGEPTQYALGFFYASKLSIAETIIVE